MACTIQPPTLCLTIEYFQKLLLKKLFLRKGQLSHIPLLLVRARLSEMIGFIKDAAVPWYAVIFGFIGS